MKKIMIFFLILSTSVKAQIEPFKIQPYPTGNFKVGRTSFHWIDSTRHEKMSKETNEMRELMVHIFYPAESNKNGTYADYIPDLDKIRQFEDSAFGKDLMKSEYGTAYDSIFKAESNSLLNVPVSRKNKTYPVLIFQPGLGMKVFMYSAIIEDIVSQGYIVVAVEPSYETSVVVFPSGKIIGEHDDWEKVYTNGSKEASAGFHFERLRENAKDNSFVATQLEKLNSGSITSNNISFKGHIDINRLGVFGHSQGGMAARETVVNDNRFIAAINLDGGYSDIENGMIAGDTLRNPFLVIQGEFSGSVKAQMMKNQTLMQFTNPIAPAFLYSISTKGFTHFSYYDFEMSDQVRNFFLEKKGVSVNRVRDIMLIRVSIHAFFDKYLLDKKQGVDSLHDKYPDIIIEPVGLRN